MNIPGSPEGFDAKVRFAREVEQCLLEPELAPAPNLLLHVRERVLRAKLRRARVNEVRRLVVMGGAFVCASVLGALRFAAPFELWLDRLAHARAIQATIRGAATPFARPLDVVLGLSGAGALTVAAMLGLVTLYLIRDLFSDPLRGVVSRNPVGPFRSRRPGAR